MAQPFDLNNYPSMNNFIQQAIPIVTQLPRPQQPAENQQQQNPSFNIPQTEVPQPPQTNLSPAQTAQNVNEAQQMINDNSQNKTPLIIFDSNSGLPNRNDDMSGVFSKISKDPLTGQNYSDAKKLFDLKSTWEAIEKGLAANKDLSADKVAAWRNEQKNIADYAAMIRRSAVENGFNPDDYGLGSGNTLEQSTQALHYLQNRDMKNFLDLQSAAEKASETYNELRAQGVEPYRANYLANREFDGNRRDVMNQLSNALHTYGINPDGSYNSYGHQIMEKMYQENPQIVKDLYTSQFANPKEVYSAQNTMLNNLLAQMGADSRTAAQIAANMYGKQFDAYNDFVKLGLVRDFQHKENEANRAISWKQLSLQEQRDRTNAYNSGIKNMIEYEKYLANTTEGKFKSLFNIADILYKGDVDKMTAFMEQQYHGGASGNKNYQAQETANKTFKNNLTLIKNAIRNGDKEKAKEIIAKLNTDFGDKDAGFVGVWGDSDFIKATTTLGLLSDAIDEKIGFAEVDKMIYDLDAIPTRGVGTGDQYMAEAINSGRLKDLIAEELKKRGRRRSDSSSGFSNSIIENYGRVAPSGSSEIYGNQPPYTTGGGTGYRGYGQ